MLDAFLNNFINTLIRDLPIHVRYFISFILFSVSLLFFNKAIRIKSDLSPIRVGWAVLFVVTVFLSIIYVSL